MCFPGHPGSPCREQRPQRQQHGPVLPQLPALLQLTRLQVPPAPGPSPAAAPQLRAARGSTCHRPHLRCSGFPITGSCATGCPPGPGRSQPLASSGTAACTHAPLLRTQGRQLRWRHARLQSHTLSQVAMPVPGEGGGPGRGGGRSAPGRTQPCPVARLSCGKGGCGEWARPCAGSPRWLIAVLYFIK